MKQKIIDHIIKIIDSLYPDYPISDIEMHQDFKPPRFLVSCYSAYPRPKLAKAGFFYVVNLDIIFDPGPDGDRLVNAVSYNLMLALREPHPFRVTSLKDTTTEDGILHLLLDVEVELHEEEQKEGIKNLIFNTDIEVTNGE